jgi:hypothetical protein
MNTVPNELVEAILVLATPGTAAALGSGAVYDPLDMLVGRLRLASVCRLWRDLLQDCNLHQLLLQSLSTTAAAPPPPLSLYLRPRKDPHRPRCGLREACWIIAHQQCKYVGHYTPPAPINIWRCLILSTCARQGDVGVYVAGPEASGQERAGASGLQEEAHRQLAQAGSRLVRWRVASAIGRGAPGVGCQDASQGRGAVEAVPTPPQRRLYATRPQVHRGEQQHAALLAEAMERDASCRRGTAVLPQGCTSSH